MQSSPRIEELRQKFHENPRRYFAPLANEYRKAGDPEQAIAICRAHLAQQPGHMSGHVVYGQALYDAGRIDEANTVFRQALALDPENMIVLRHLGDIARQRGEVEEARSWYSRALDGDPHDTEVAAYLAELTEPLSVNEPDTAPPVAPEPEVPAADTAEATFDANFDALTFDEGLSEPARQTVPAEEDSPYLEETPAMSSAAEERTAPEEPPAIAETPVSDEAKEEALAPEPEPEDRGYRTTPAYEGSPIITRTLAELYLEQGYIEPALEIYRQLAEREPHDQALQARITELSADAEESPEFAVAEETPPREIESVEEVGEQETAAVSEPLTDIWDAPDSWGADMFEDVGDGGEIFGMTSTVRDELAAASEPEPPTVEEQAPTSLPEAIAEADAEIQSEPEIEEPSIQQPTTIDEQPSAIEPAARGITIREFFATLGSMRPPTVNGEDALTSQEEAPAETQTEEESYPYADDAFATLFQDAPVNPEDSRAAAALSSAVAHNPPSSGITTPAESRSSGEPGGSQSPDQGIQESEEDIRRFREWLDGLASS